MESGQDNITYKAETSIAGDAISDLKPDQRPLAQNVSEIYGVSMCSLATLYHHTCQ